MTSDFADMAQDQLAAQAAAEIAMRRVETSEQRDSVRLKRDGDKRRRRKPMPPKTTGQEHRIDVVV